MQALKEHIDEADEVPRYMTDISRNEALKLWLELSRGKIQQINARPWLRDEA